MHLYISIKYSLHNYFFRSFAHSSSSVRNIKWTPLVFSYVLLATRTNTDFLRLNRARVGHTQKNPLCAEGFLKLCILSGWNQYVNRIYRKRINCYFATASFKAFPGLKTGTFLASIVIASPVWGLRPVRAPLSLTSKLPNPTS